MEKLAQGFHGGKRGSRQSGQKGKERVVEGKETEVQIVLDTVSLGIAHLATPEIQARLSIARLVTPEIEARLAEEVFVLGGHELPELETSVERNEGEKHLDWR